MHELEVFSASCWDPAWIKTRSLEFHTWLYEHLELRSRQMGCFEHGNNVNLANVVSSQSQRHDHVRAMYHHGSSRAVDSSCQ